MVLTVLIRDSDPEFWSEIVVSAVQAVKTVNNRNETKYPIRSVNILKAHGRSATESTIIPGYALNCKVAAQG